MNEGLAVRILKEVMNWDDDTIARESTWLRLMSDLKYDSYRDYLGGMRFSERLVDWLQQFRQEDRQTAYNFVKEHLIFISFAEMQHLVDCFYPATVEPTITNAIAAEIGIPIWQLRRDLHARKTVENALRRSLFVGLSDGARMDAFRRANEGRISNEQVLVTPQVNASKWNDVLKELRDEVQDNTARFTRIFLIDDFVGSGKTLLRYENGKWKGKLWKFRTEHPSVFETHLSADCAITVHHYVASAEAEARVAVVEAEAREKLGAEWFKNVEFTFGLVLPPNSKLNQEREPLFWKLTDDYYDKGIETDAIRVGGETAKRGFGDCGLPLILEHNTPNNSIALLWADSNGTEGHAMRPLFRRAQRHW